MEIKSSIHGCFRGQSNITGTFVALADKVAPWRPPSCKRRQASWSFSIFWKSFAASSKWREDVELFECASGRSDSAGKAAGGLACLNCCIAQNLYNQRFNHCKTTTCLRLAAEVLAQKRLGRGCDKNLYAMLTERDFLLLVQQNGPEPSGSKCSAKWLRRKSAL